MPLYEFIDEKTGDGIELVYGMADAPKIGSKVRKYGRSWTRVASQTSKAKVWSRAFAAKSIELNHPDAPRVNSAGEAVFQSQREVDEFCARTGMVYE